MRFQQMARPLTDACWQIAIFCTSGMNHMYLLYKDPISSFMSSSQPDRKQQKDAEEGYHPTLQIKSVASWGITAPLFKNPIQKITLPLVKFPFSHKAPHPQLQVSYLYNIHGMLASN